MNEGYGRGPSLEIALEALTKENNALSEKVSKAESVVHDLERSELRFKTIFENSTLGNKIINADLEIIKVNKALIELLGYSKEELIGMRIMDIAHPDFKEPWKSLQKELWTHRKDSFTIDACIIKKDQSALWCQVTSILFSDQDQTFGYSIIQDISWRKDLEEQVKQSNIKSLKVQKGQQKKIMEVVIDTQEQERKRIAEGMHNNLGQLFYGVKLNLQQIDLDHSSLQENRNSLKRTNELLSECIRESRRISYELSPSILEDFGLIGAIKDTCSILSNKVKFDCSFFGPTKQLDKSLEIAVYRIVQELMLNIVKHADASYARVNVTIHAKAVLIKVEDNGKGFEPGLNQDKGLGLKYLRSKLDIFQGTLNIASTPKTGTTINISLPN